MDKTLTKLLAQLQLRIEALMDALAGGLDPATWAQQFSQQLATYHQAAVLASGQELTDAAATWLTKMVGTQIQFLDQFRLVIQDAETFQEGWRARAQMYGSAVGASFEAGKTRMLPLPAMPRDGSTTCLSNCTCSWDIQQLAGDNNYDCTWRLGAQDHCATCRTRARLWAPLKIRKGRLV